MKVLVAEDDRISSLFLRKSLEQLGYSVVSAEDGEAAWAALQDPEIRLVISDWMMPRIDGLELCRRLRDRAGRRYVYFILLTAKSCKEERLQALNVGADDFLPKPLDRAELTARLSVARRLLSMEEELNARTLEVERMQRELEDRNSALQLLATTDPLTGLKNRRYFMERLESFITFGIRQSMPISVVMIDVDHFKSYNDAFGHTAGDEILVRFGRALVENVRDHDVVARYGGEEFVILLPATDENTSRRIAERIREAIEAISWESRPITASLGVSTVLAEPLSPRHLIDRADEALYRAKLEGRNRVRHACELSSSCLPDPLEPNVESASPSGVGRSNDASSFEVSELLTSPRLADQRRLDSFRRRFRISM